MAVVPYTDLDRAVIDSRTEGFCKLIVDRETHRLVAAHVVGEQALEIVHVVAAGIARPICGSSNWPSCRSPLPDLHTMLGLAARRLVAELGVTPLAPEWHALGKGPGRVGKAGVWTIL